MNKTIPFAFAVGLSFGLVISFMFSNYGQLHKMHKYYHVVNTADTLHDENHNVINKLTGPKTVFNFNDEKFHQHDDDSVAKLLKKKVRVLCWVMTAPSNLQTKAIHVKATWGRRCNVLLFMSSQEDKSFPAVGLSIGEGRDHLTAKTMRAFKYVYDHHFQDADWFMKGDDDTYVIVENLRYFLSSYNKSDPVYFGHHFKTIVKQGYNSGGGGYVLSKEALRRFATRGYDKVCSKDGGAEDVEMGRCMEMLGVRVGDTRDAGGRSRFHCFDPGLHLRGGYPGWYLQYDKYGAKYGKGNISDYSITFHYVNPNQMYELEFYVYHLRPYGIVDHPQHLNLAEDGHGHHEQLAKEAKPSAKKHLDEVHKQERKQENRTKH